MAYPTYLQNEDDRNVQQGTTVSSATDQNSDEQATPAAPSWRERMKSGVYGLQTEAPKTPTNYTELQQAAGKETAKPIEQQLNEQVTADLQKDAQQQQQAAQKKQDDELAKMHQELASRYESTPDLDTFKKEMRDPAKYEEYRKKYNGIYSGLQEDADTINQNIQSNEQKYKAQQAAGEGRYFNTVDPQTRKVVRTVQLGNDGVLRDAKTGEEVHDVPTNPKSSSQQMYADEIYPKVSSLIEAGKFDDVQKIVGDTLFSKTPEQGGYGLSAQDKTANDTFGNVFGRLIGMKADEYRQQLIASMDDQMEQNTKAGIQKAIDSRKDNGEGVAVDDAVEAENKKMVDQKVEAYKQKLLKLGYNEKDVEQDLQQFRADADLHLADYNSNEAKAKRFSSNPFIQNVYKGLADVGTGIQDSTFSKIYDIARVNRGNSYGVYIDNLTKSLDASRMDMFTQALHGAVAFGADMPFYGWAGKIGGFALSKFGGVVARTLDTPVFSKFIMNRLTQTGIERGAASQMLQRALTQNSASRFVTNLMVGSANGALTFGIKDGFDGFLDPYAKPVLPSNMETSTRYILAAMQDCKTAEDFQKALQNVDPTTLARFSESSALDLFQEAMASSWDRAKWGTLSGAAFVGTPFGEAIGHGRSLGWKMLGDVTKLGINATGMTAVQALEQYKKTGEWMSASELEKTELQNLLSLGILDGIGMYRRIRNYDAERAREQVTDLSDEYKAFARTHRIPMGMDLMKAIADGTLQLPQPAQGKAHVTHKVQLFQRVKGEDGKLTELTPEQKALEAQVNGYLANTDVPEVMRAQMYSTLSGMGWHMSVPNRTSAIRSDAQSDRLAVDLLDSRGNVITTHYYKNREEAEKGKVELDQSMTVADLQDLAMDYHNRAASYDLDNTIGKEYDALQPKRTRIERAQNKMQHGGKKALSKRERKDIENGFSQHEQDVILVCENQDKMQAVQAKMSNGATLTEEEQALVDASNRLYADKIKNGTYLEDSVKRFEAEQGLDAGEFDQIRKGHATEAEAQEEAGEDGTVVKMGNRYYTLDEMQILRDYRDTLARAINEDDARQARQIQQATQQAMDNAMQVSGVDPNQQTTAQHDNANDAISEARSSGMQLTGQQRQEAEQDYQYYRGVVAGALGCKPEEVDAKLGFNGDNAAEVMANIEKSMSGNQKDAAKKYIIAREQHEGIMDAINEKAQAAAQEAKQKALQFVHKDGKVYHGTTKENHSIYILRGNVEIDENGYVIPSSSEKYLNIYDETTGKMDSCSPEDILLMRPVQEGEQFVNEAVQQAVDKALAQDNAELRAMADFTPNSTIDILDTDGQRKTVTVLQDLGGDNCVVLMDGKQVQISKSAIQAAHEQAEAQDVAARHEQEAQAYATPEEAAQPAAEAPKAEQPAQAQQTPTEAPKTAEPAQDNDGILYNHDGTISINNDPAKVHDMFKEQGILDEMTKDGIEKAAEDMTKIDNEKFTGGTDKERADFYKDRARRKQEAVNRFEFWKKVRGEGARRADEVKQAVDEHTPAQPAAEGQQQTAAQPQRAVNPNAGIRPEDRVKVKGVSPEKLDIIDQAARNLGLQVVFVSRPLETGWHGEIDLDNGIITLNEYSDRALDFVLGHEMTHDMQQLAPEAYDAFKTLALQRKMKELGMEGYNGYVKQGVDAYKNFIYNKYYDDAIDKGMTEEAAKEYAQKAADEFTSDHYLDEIAADMAGSLVENPETVKDIFKNTTDVGTLEKIRNAVMQYIDKIARYIGLNPNGSTSEIDALRESMNTMFNEAVKNAQELRTTSIAKAEPWKQGERMPTAEEVMEQEAPELQKTKASITLAPDIQKSSTSYFEAYYEGNGEKKASYAPLAISKQEAPITRDELEAGNAVIDTMVDYMRPYLEATSEGKRILPEEVYGKGTANSTIMSNGSYGKTMENTSLCLRTLSYNDFVDNVKKKLGRPLTQRESFLASQMVYDIAKDPQCLYCYVSLDRKAYDEFLLRYVQDRDAVVDKYNAMPAAQREFGKNAPHVALKDLYTEFLNGRKDTKQQAARFDQWINIAHDGGDFVREADLTTQEVRADIRSGADKSMADQMKDIEAYARSASWAKKNIDYRSYTGELLKLSNSWIKKLTGEYGLRFYSFSEYSPAFIVENMQMVRDAALRGLKGLAYTKETDFVKIFAPTGININCSTYGRRDENGNIVADTNQGADWNEVQELRKQYPNVGGVFVATDDDMVRWALAQDWIDVVIPFHIVRTGADIADFYKWTNFSSEQADRQREGNRSKYISPAEHHNDRTTFLRLCDEQGYNPRFMRFLDDPNYMKLVNETRRSVDETVQIKPVFNLEAAKESFDNFVDDGGYYGGWWDVDEKGYVDAVNRVVEDVKAGREANQVEYGRQDMPINVDKMAAAARKHRQHGNKPVTFGSAEAKEVAQKNRPNKKLSIDTTYTQQAEDTKKVAEDKLNAYKQAHDTKTLDEYVAANKEAKLAQANLDTVTKANEEIEQKAGDKLPEGARIMYSLSTDLDRDYPDWKNQERKNGGHNTQISGTTRTYEKIGQHLLNNGESGKDILDASSGLGLGTQALRAQGFNVDDVEPFQSNERLNSEKGLLPATFKSYDDLKKKYDVVISNAVLNVIPDDWRAGVVKQMADATKVGGKMIVNVRGANEVDGIKNKIELESPYELLIPKGNNEQGQPTYAYQRFWTKPEFRDYMQQQLGEDWKVEIGNEANSGTKSGTVAVCYKVKDTAPEGGKKKYSLGVPYQGSKSTIGKDIVDLLPEGKRFVDLFSGGGAMTHAAILSGKYDTFHMNDKFPMGQQLFLDAVDGKYHDYDRHVSKDEFYNGMQYTPEGIMHSFNGNARSYAAVDKTGRDKAAEQVKRVKALESLKDYRSKITDSADDYQNVPVQDGDVLYADIPYKGTGNTSYKNAGKFDMKAFTDWAAKIDQPVYVSSFEAPEGFTEIWSSKELPSFKAGTRKVEKLFVQDKFADVEKARIAAEKPEGMAAEPRRNESPVQRIFEHGKTYYSDMVAPMKYEDSAKPYEPKSLSPEGAAHMELYTDPRLAEARKQIKNLSVELGGHPSDASNGAFQSEEGVTGIADAKKAETIGKNMVEALNDYKDKLTSILEKGSQTKVRQQVFGDAIKDVDDAIKWYGEFAQGEHNKLGEHDDANIRFSIDAIKKYADEVETNRPRKEVLSNIVSGLHALRAIANGKDSVEKAMFRPDLQKYGSDGNILIEWGKAGNPEKDFKKGFGISHIAARHGDDTVINVVNALATGDIDRYVDGNKTIVISNGKYEATLALTKYGDNKTWLLSGWDKIENTDGSGKVSASTTPTQGNPTFSRESLGAVISDANLRKLFLPANGNENNLNKNKNSANQTLQNEGGIRESIDVNPEQTKTDNFKKWFGDSKVVDEEGKPKVVYHGTNDASFTEFENGKGNALSWFSDSNDHAQKYANFNKEWNEEAEPYVDDENLSPNGVYPVYLSVKKPLEVGHLDDTCDSPEFAKIAKTFGMTAQELADHCQTAFDDAKTLDQKKIWEVTNSVRFAELLRKSGYDGVVATESDGVKTYGALDPTQIKSATANNGDFDANNPDIRYSIDVTKRMRQRRGESDADFQQRKTDYQNLVVSNPAEARKRVTDEIRGMLDDQRMSAVSKSTLNQMLKEVRDADDENLLTKINDVHRTMNVLSEKALDKQIDALTKFKVQKRNGRNMSVAKSVDDSTRKAFEFLRGQLTDFASSDHDAEKHAINSQLSRLYRENAFLIKQHNAETDPDKQATFEQQIADNKQTIADLQAELADIKEQIVQDRPNKERANKDTVEQLLEHFHKKFNESVTDGGEWTADDDAMLLAVNLLNKRLGVDDLQAQWNALKIIHDTSLVPDMQKAVEDKDETRQDEIQRQMDANQEQRDIILQQKVDKKREIASDMNGMIEGGRESLKDKVLEEKSRKSKIILGFWGDISKGAMKEYTQKELDDMEQVNGLRRGLRAVVGSFEYMAKHMAQNSLGEDSWFYRYFMTGKNGVVAAQDAYTEGLRLATKAMNDKAQELFGEKYMNVIKDNEKVDKDCPVFREKEIGGEPVKIPYPMSKGQATYLYMVWKMPDGRVKLENQGFTKESIEKAKEFIGDKNVAWADWIQDTYLPELRKKYNAKYVELYNTSMANIENYVPLKIDSQTRHQDVEVDQMMGQQTLNQKVGSLVNRTFNLNAVDLTRSAYEVISEHVQNMEEWNAFARVRQDLNYILSSTAIRNTMNANEAGSHERLVKAAQIATNCYKSESTAASKLVTYLGSALAGSNIAFRNTTALKQMLSMPAFFGYSQNPKFVGRLLLNAGINYAWMTPTFALTAATGGWFGKRLMDNASSSDRTRAAAKIALSRDFNWCVENIPSFRYRVSKGSAGNIVLDEFLSGDKTWFDRFKGKLGQYGMAANGLVDSFTCAIGIKTIYDFKYNQQKAELDKLLKDNQITTEEHAIRLKEADRLAKMDANIYYNGTQQSNHPAFLAPVQMDGDTASKMFTLYKNSPISYARKGLLSVRDFINQSRHWNEFAENEARNIMQAEGLTFDEAIKQANAHLRAQFIKNGVSSALYLYGINWLWNWGGRGFLGFFQQDDEEDNSPVGLYKDAKGEDAKKGALADVADAVSPVLNGIPVVDLAVNTVAGNDVEPLLLYNVQAEVSELFKKYNDGKDVSKELAYAVLNTATRSGVGVDINTATNTYLGLEHLAKEGLWDGNDQKMLDLMFLLNTPNSNRKQVARKLYMDYTPEEFDKAILRAEKAMDAVNADYHQYLPSYRILSKQQHDKIRKEYADAHRTAEQQAVIDKNKANTTKEIRKAYPDRVSLINAFNKENDPYRKEQMAAVLKKMYAEADSTAAAKDTTEAMRYDALIKKGTEIKKKAKEAEKDEYMKRAQSYDVVNDIAIKADLDKMKPVWDKWKELGYNKTEAGRQYNKQHIAELKHYQKKHAAETIIGKMKKVLADDKALNNMQILKKYKTLEEKRTAYMEQIRKMQQQALNN